MGDSQFVRFSRQLLNYENMSYRQIQYCVSGQTILDLYTQLKREEFDVHTKVIVMIGTNDMLRNSNINDMKMRYWKLLDYLKRRTKKLILVTIPPIAKDQHKPIHWVKLQIFNEFIRKQVDGKHISCINLSDKLLIGKNQVNLNYYEKCYNNSPKPDLIHLNRKGFEVLKNLIDSEYDTWRME